MCPGYQPLAFGSFPMHLGSGTNLRVHSRGHEEPWQLPLSITLGRDCSGAYVPRALALASRPVTGCPRSDYAGGESAQSAALAGLRSKPKHCLVADATTGGPVDRGDCP